MKDIMKEDDPTGLRRMFPDVPWDSPEMDALGEDINHFIDFIQESRELRRAEGLTQSDMARRLKTTQSCVSDFERIGGDPRIHTIQRYARAMGYRARLVLEKIPES
jgi:ribosome-binding protein aMBF1 (putative translation factor)